MNDWKDKTCKDCEFHNEGFCHKSPPSTNEGKTFYPKVAFYRGLMITDYMNACAEFLIKD
jgi:hypothetical protein